MRSTCGSKRTCLQYVPPPGARHRCPCASPSPAPALTRLARQKQHQHYNELLNKLKTTPTSAHPSSTLAYQHLHLVDTFYAQDGGGRGDKVRVTRDEKTGTVLECVRKIRLADLNIYSPKRAADWRISVNLEVPGACLSISLRYELWARSGRAGVVSRAMACSAFAGYAQAVEFG